MTAPCFGTIPPELCSLIIAVLVTIAAVALTFLLPADADTSGYKGVLLTSVIRECRPEPTEMLRYLLTVLLLPSVFLVLYYYTGKREWRLAPSTSFFLQMVLVIVIAALLVISFIATYHLGNAFHHKVTGYFRENYQMSMFFILPEICFLIFFIYISSNNTDSIIHRVLFFSVLAVVFSYSIWRIASVNYMYQASTYNLHHYYACWYPIAKVDAGQTIGVDFRSIYGFYPYLVIPIFKLLGGVNQHSSALLLTALLTSVALSYCIFCYRFFRNKILALVVSVFCSVYGPFSLLGDHAQGDKRQYFQYNPLRTFFLGLTLIAIVIRSNLKSKRSILILNIVMTLLGGLAIFWNFESGIIYAVLWTVYNIYETAVDKKLFSRETLRTALFSALRLAASVGIFVLLVLLITFFRRGQILTLHEVFFGITVFAGTGFNMVPISFGIWVVFAVIAAVSLIIVIPYLTRRKTCPGSLRTTLSGLFAASAAVIGSFMYFVGRSYSTNVLFFFPVSLISCGLLIEYFLAQKRENESFCADTVLRWAKIFLCCVVIAEAFLPSASIVFYSFTRDYAESHLLSSDGIKKLYRDADYITEWANKNNSGKPPMILTFYSMFFSEHIGVKPTEHICEQVDWFYIDDARSYLECIKSRPNDSFVVDLTAYEVLTGELKDEWKKLRKNYSLSEKYTNDETEYTLYFYKPK